ncbi:MAG: PorT family protein [Schleiferiaceae bacterium]|nr:PorT family protein [Schleiferiaceae bacterium]
MKTKLRYLLVFTIFTSILPAIAQKNYATKPQKWTIGMYSGPTWNHFQNVYNQEFNGPKYLPQEKPKFTPLGGVEVAYFWSPSWGISLGAQYINRGYFQEINAAFRDEIDPFYGLVREIQTPTPLRITYNYQYIDFPISLQYVYGKRKWRFQTSAGLAMSYLFTATTTIRYPNKPSDSRPYTAGGEPFHKFHLFPILTVGAQYYLNKNWMVQLSPFGQHALTQVSETPRSERHWTVGLRAGMAYVF